jgi:hypothetical protein
MGSAIHNNRLLTDGFQIDWLYHEPKTPRRSSTNENRSGLIIILVVEIRPELFVEIVPTAVVEMTPVRVVEMVPDFVVEIVPALVVEMVPGLPTAETDIARSKIPAQMIG